MSPRTISVPLKKSHDPKDGEDFIAAKNYGGEIQDYVFRNGGMGLGYYRVSAMSSGGGSFIPASKPSGMKLGYVFMKNGVFGAGYYRMSGKTPRGSAPSEFKASAQFAGTKPGFIYRQGNQGLGYYKTSIPIPMGSEEALEATYINGDPISLGDEVKRGTHWDWRVNGDEDGGIGQLGKVVAVNKNEKGIPIPGAVCVEWPETGKRNTYLMGYEDKFELAHKSDNTTQIVVAPEDDPPLPVIDIMNYSG